ncbi:DNRLRE domain-containing protein [Arthrobacter sp. ISL-48]|uniref:alkaline phosphatase family protein n=1 Tax=Arthrobacter sp. ISL-48 TaxID=2819110 RepID=UPI001BEBD9BD|nr:alkaline phosphatase family protein [Arthrobacter sp. ISL-48]MBT2530956.1 DNRLRE domain-containing protein [Arthrobacter sp. ISL-48]
MFRHLRLFLASLLALATIGAFAFLSGGPRVAALSPTSVTLNAVADSYLSAASPNSNFGAATSLAVSHSKYRALMRFDVSLPAGSIITSASLRLYATTSVNASAIVHPASSAWTETTLTYANQPPWQTSELARTGLLRGGQYDSASLPTGSVPSSGSVSFGINTTTGAQASLSSRESAYQPQLLISYESASSTTSTPTATATSTSTTTATPTATPTALGVPAFDHIVVVMEENTNYTNIIGSTNAPYINSLANTGANLTQMYAETHPSEPDYLALYAGSTFGISNDNCPQPLAAANLGDQLKNAGKSFIGYSENLPSDGWTGCISPDNQYKAKHAPWTNFPGGYAYGHMFSEFPTDYSTLPAVSFVIPNMCDDMHDCSVSIGDTWLKDNMDGYAQWAKTHNSLLVVTWDEDDTTGGNHIPAILYGANVVQGSYSQITNHYGLLGMIEDANMVPRIGNAVGELAVLAPFGQLTG